MVVELLNLIFTNLVARPWCFAFNPHVLQLHKLQCMDSYLCKVALDHTCVGFRMRLEGPLDLCFCWTRSYGVQEFVYPNVHLKLKYVLTVMCNCHIVISRDFGVNFICSTFHELHACGEATVEHIRSGCSCPCRSYTIRLATNEKERKEPNLLWLG